MEKRKPRLAAGPEKCNAVKSRKENKRKPTKRARAKAHQGKAAISAGDYEKGYWEGFREGVGEGIRHTEKRLGAGPFGAAATDILSGRARLGSKLLSEKVVRTYHQPRGPSKGKLQPDTRQRIKDAALLSVFNFPPSKMASLLYPEQHVPRVRLQAYQKFQKRNGAAIEAERKALRGRAEQVKKSWAEQIKKSSLVN